MPSSQGIARPASSANAKGKLTHKRKKEAVVTAESSAIKKAKKVTNSAAMSTKQPVRETKLEKRERFSAEESTASEGDDASGSESDVSESDCDETAAAAAGSSDEKSSKPVPQEEKEIQEQKEAEMAALQYDPYLLKDREYQAVHPERRWTNKQRCFVLCSRGVVSLHRHLMDDIKKLLPQSKSDVKWNKKCSFLELVEAAEEANCNNIIYLEARRRRNLYMWLCKAPEGPSIKFEVFNIHTMGSTNFTGNHLLHSRPLLIFDPIFETHEYLKVMRELFLQVWGTPRYHPKSKPFHDHVLSFLWLDGKVWIRHYQIFSPKFTTKIEHQNLREVGPRLVLEPIRMFDCPFGGKTLWKNPDYISPRDKILQQRTGQHVESLDNYEEKQWTKMRKQKRTIRFVDYKNTLLTLRDKLRRADDD